MNSNIDMNIVLFGIIFQDLDKAIPLFSQGE